MPPLDQGQVPDDTHIAIAKVKRRTRKANGESPPKTSLPSGDEFAGQYNSDTQKRIARNRRGQSRSATQSVTATADELEHAGYELLDTQHTTASVPSGQRASDTHADTAAGESFADHRGIDTQSLPVGNGRVQRRFDHQRHHDASENLSDGQIVTGTHHLVAIANGKDADHLSNDHHQPSVSVLPDIIELSRRRRTLIKSRTSLTLQIKAYARYAAQSRYKANGLKLPEGKFPKIEKEDLELAMLVYPELDGCRKTIDASIKVYEKKLTKLVHELPVWPWAEGVRGVAEISIATIIGEAGDLSDYRNPAKLWKRMGLGFFELDDGTMVRQRCFRDVELADKARYFPGRRAAMFVIADSIIKAGGRGRVNPYATLYRWQRRKYRRREEVKTKIHAHRMAHRWMTKRMLRDLWRAWRDASGHRKVDTQEIDVARVLQFPVAAE